MDLIRSLNQFESWRKIFGKPDPRLKDQELILRFFALYCELDKYARPMGEFLSKFAARNRKAGAHYQEELPGLFKKSTDIFYKALGREAFRPTRALNVAVFDSCMVGIAKRIAEVESLDPEIVRQAYRGLLTDTQYVEATSRSTADEAFVKRRLERATKAFSAI
jgi:hypothetical protein